MHPHIALALVVHVLAQQSLRNVPLPGVRVSTLAAGFDDADTAERARAALIAELNETEARLDAFVDLPAARLMDMLAIFGAETLNFTHQVATNEDDRIEAVADTLASRVDSTCPSIGRRAASFSSGRPKRWCLTRPRRHQRCSACPTRTARPA